MSEEMKNPAQQPEEQPAEETKAAETGAPEENAGQEPKSTARKRKRIWPPSWRPQRQQPLPPRPR